LRATLLLVAMVMSLVLPFRGDEELSRLDHWAWRLAYFGLAMVFVKAFRTSRLPSSGRNLWAVAGSCLSLGGGLYQLWRDHASVALASRGLAMTLVGVAGVVLFLRGEAGGMDEGADAGVQSCDGASDQPCET
jgi:hypothetical protein